MRTMSLLLSVAVVATFAYVFGPDLIEAYHERESLVAERQVLALPEDAKRPDSQTFEAPGSGAQLTGVKASLSHLRQVANAPKTQFKKYTKTKTPRAQRPIRRRTAAAERAELQKLGLAPASKDLRLAAETTETRTPVKMPSALPGQSIVSPMAGRWVDTLSGPKARLDMGIKDRQDTCATEYSHCARRGSSSDVKLTGVVVKTERLVQNPSRPIGGKLRTGGYVDETPAVYVE